MNRREAMRMLAGVSAASFAWTPGQATAAMRLAQAARAAPGSFEPAFFSDHEYATVRVLADMVIPADARSGSATEAGVPEFMDFMMIDQPRRQVAMRGGLAWLDFIARDRFDAAFLDCAKGQRETILDDLAWPDRAPARLSHGVAFFTAFRDLTATGFWSSKMGIDDLGYIGNRFVGRWRGCPDEQLRKLGLID